MLRHRAAVSSGSELSEALTWYDHESPLTWRVNGNGTNIQLLCKNRLWPEGAIDQVRISPDGHELLLIEGNGVFALLSRSDNGAVMGQTFLWPRFVSAESVDGKLQRQNVADLAITSVCWHSGSGNPVLLYQDGQALEIDVANGNSPKALTKSQFEWFSRKDNERFVMPESIECFSPLPEVELAYCDPLIASASLTLAGDEGVAIQKKRELHFFAPGAAGSTLRFMCDWSFAANASTIITVAQKQSEFTACVIALPDGVVSSVQTIRERTLFTNEFIPVAAQLTKSKIQVVFSAGKPADRRVAVWTWHPTALPATPSGKVAIFKLGSAADVKFSFSPKDGSPIALVFENDSWPSDLTRTVRIGL